MQNVQKYAKYALINFLTHSEMLKMCFQGVSEPSRKTRKKYAFAYKSGRYLLLMQSAKSKKFLLKKSEKTIKTINNFY
jgi:hypothetical protein